MAHYQGQIRCLAQTAKNQQFNTIIVTTLNLSTLNPSAVHVIRNAVRLNG